MILCETQHIFKSFPIEGGILRKKIGQVQALHGVSIQLKQQETVALVGGSGSGKTTLGKIIAGLLNADSGTVLWKGTGVAEMGRAERARRIQLIFQDPFASLNPKLSIGTQLREVVFRTGVRDTTSRCMELLNSVGMSENALNFYPFQFSGGQRQRIAIARALALEPELIVADEPLSALDVSIQAQILELFRTLRARLRLTMLFITHDLAVASQYADRVIVLQEGRIVEEGPAAATLQNPRHSYTRKLLEAVPRLPC